MEWRMERALRLLRMERYDTKGSGEKMTQFPMLSMAKWFRFMFQCKSSCFT
jgi:hypothetical protein